jgi:dephospho-CoA kinase
MGYIVGLTGGIGSGKSAASQWFAAQGIAVVDADVVAKEVVQPGTQLLGQIQASFGDWVLLADGALNRPALREHIFNHPAARQQLEALTHPAIRQELLRQLQTARSPYVLLVSPLLFETGQHLLSQRTLLIDVPESLQLQRASQRDGQSPAQIEKIMAIQMPRAQKQQLADDVVSNHLDLAHLYQQLQHRHQHYLHLAQAA